MATLVKVWYNDGDMIEDAESVQGLDFNASMDRFEAQLTDSLREQWPGAEVEIIRNRAVTGWCRRAEVDGLTGTVSTGIADQICSDVYQIWDWLVAE